MHRREFISTGLATASAIVFGRDGIVERDRPATTAAEVPSSAEWVPAESHVDRDAGVAFTHLDWETFDELDQEERDEDEPVRFEDPERGPPTRHYPIIDLPLRSVAVTSAALFGVFPYPFAEAVVPEGPTAPGVTVTASTWVDDVLVFHGEYEPDVFADLFADGFEAAAERNDFTVYVGDASPTDGLAYAVSETSLVVGLVPGEDVDYVPADAVDHVLDGYVDDRDRAIDDEDGTWLFETTGDAPIALGAWSMDDRQAVPEPDAPEADGTAIDATRDDDPDVRESPVFADLESFVNTLAFDVVDGELRDVEARFAGLYPDDAVPSEDEIRRELIGGAFVPHDLTTEADRVDATVTLEDEREDPATRSLAGAGHP